MARNRRRSDVLIADSATGGPRVAWRIWSIIPDPAQPERPVLAGIAGQVWDKAHIEARCAESTSSHWYHRWVPDVDCSCGVYGLSEFGQAPDHSPRRPYAVGFVELSGRILIEESSLRAERGEMIGPLRLVVPDTWRNGSRRIVTGEGAYRAVPSWIRVGTPAAEWEADTRRQLRWRYGVDAISLEH
ncbi:MAG: hypothetical protein OEO77_15130 [Acidimicrobiia bacterium]|nr:hypothetical protein [Acidimicrobiia bacterium]